MNNKSMTVTAALLLLNHAFDFLSRAQRLHSEKKARAKWHRERRRSQRSARSEPLPMFSPCLARIRFRLKLSSLISEDSWFSGIQRSFYDDRSESGRIYWHWRSSRHARLARQRWYSGSLKELPSIMAHQKYLPNWPNLRSTPINAPHIP